MKKNLFTIEESEKQRILEMHLNATKKLYINEEDNAKTATTNQTNVVDFGSDPDFVALNNTIKQINDITLQWPSPSKGFSDVNNLKKQIRIYAKPNTRTLSLFSQKVDSVNTVDPRTRPIMNMNLGSPVNTSSFNPGTEFVAAKNQKTVGQAEELLKRAVEEMAKFVGKFPQNSYFQGFAENGYKIVKQSV